MKYSLALFLLIPAAAFLVADERPDAQFRLVDRVIHATPADDLQSIVDSLADGQGGTVVLYPGATYENVRLTLPWDKERKYRGIKLQGNRSILRSAKDATEPVIWVGRGWADWDAEKLTVIEISGVIVEQRSNAYPNAKGIWIEFTKGTLVKDCEFRNCPLEALYEGGGHSNVGMCVIGCRAVGCGKGWVGGSLAGFNLNGFGCRLINSAAEDCGWGLESGGTELRVSATVFTSAPVALGSTVYGVSNQIITGCTFERSHIEVSNGIGRLADVRIVGNTMLDSPFCFSGAASKNHVDLPRLPWHDHPSIFTGNTIVGRAKDWRSQGVRLTSWNLPSPPLRIEGNRFDVPDGQAVVSQGLPGVVVFDGNAWPDEWRTVYRHLPDGTPLPDPVKGWKVGR